MENREKNSMCNKGSLTSAVSAGAGEQNYHASSGFQGSTGNHVKRNLSPDLLRTQILQGTHKSAA